jgi:tyrosinase
MAKILLFCVLVALCTATCTIKGKRRPWHTLTNLEKSAYIDAELCLMAKPATLGLPAAQTRFDEFQAVHQLQSYATHYVVGSFVGVYGRSHDKA